MASCSWKGWKKGVLLSLLTCLSISYFLQFIVSEQNRLSVHPLMYSETKEKLKPTPYHEPISLNPRLKVLPWKFVQEPNFEGQEHVFIPKEKAMQNFEFDFKLKGEKVCEKVSPFLLVMVPSLPGNKNIRAFIRETWASVSKSQEWPLRIVNAEVKVIFMLGNSTPKEFEEIQEENKKHQDLILADFVDSYRNLTWKILMGLAWAKKYCSDAKFIMKCDEDTFVNIPLIIDFLIAFQSQFNMTVIGYIFEKAQVLRSGRWQVDINEYPISFYPPYASGNAYVMQRDLAFHVLNVSKYMPYIPVEDAFITGILTRIVHGKHVHSETYTSLADKNPKTCEFLNDQRQACTGSTKFFMEAIWKTFQTNRCFRQS